MNPALRYLRHGTIALYALAAGVLLTWALSPVNADPTATALYGIVLGIAASWLGSGGWSQKERWTIRLQSTIIGVSILGLAHVTGGADVASAGLLLMIFTTLFLFVCHLTPQVLRIVQAQLVTTVMFARVEAARQILYFSSFAVPLALTLAPGPIGIGFVAISGFAVGYLTSRRARRILTNGLAREAA